MIPMARPWKTEYDGARYPIATAERQEHSNRVDPHRDGDRIFLVHEEDDSADCDDFIAFTRYLRMCGSEAGALFQFPSNACGT